jgi:amino acid transporter
MSTSDSANATALAMFAAFWVVWLLIFCAILILHILCYWRIASKAGYQGILSLLMLVPLVNFIVLLYFAFTDWPIELELRHLRGGGAPPPGTSVMPT